VHVHAVVRLDGPDGPETAPTAWAAAELLAEAVGRAAARASVTVEGSSGREPVVRWVEHFERLKASGFASVGYGRGERT